MVFNKLLPSDVLNYLKKMFHITLLIYAQTKDKTGVMLEKAINHSDLKPSAHQQSCGVVCDRIGITSHTMLTLYKTTETSLYTHISPPLYPITGKKEKN